MKVKINEELLFELTEIQKSVLKDNISADILEEDLKRRIFYIINHKYEQCFKNLKLEWEPKLAAKGISTIPTDKDAFTQLVLAQPEYKDKKKRDLATVIKL